jgi:SAM-dependent methyltransferase
MAKLTGPARFDPDMAHPARVYAYWLGSKDHYPADRKAAEEVAAQRPQVVAGARTNRAFLARSVRYLASQQGIRQFLDIGPGLPAALATHEVAQTIASESRVVYVDNDPVVVRHAGALTGRAPGVCAVLADLRQPRDLLSALSWRRLLDLAQPVAVLLVAVLHFVADDEDPWAVVDCYKDQVAPGSYLVISHVTADHLAPGAARRAQAAYAGASAPGVARSREQVAGFFAGLEMVAPGLVNLPDWRPAHIGPAGGPAVFYAGIGRKTTPGRPR